MVTWRDVTWSQNNIPVWSFIFWQDRAGQMAMALMTTQLQHNRRKVIFPSSFMCIIHSLIHPIWNIRPFIWNSLINSVVNIANFHDSYLSVPIKSRRSNANIWHRLIPVSKYCNSNTWLYDACYTLRSEHVWDRPMTSFSGFIHEIFESGQI